MHRSRHRYAYQLTTTCTCLVDYTIVVTVQLLRSQKYVGMNGGSSCGYMGSTPWHVAVYFWSHGSIYCYGTSVELLIVLLWYFGANKKPKLADVGASRLTPRETFNIRTWAIHNTSDVWVVLFRDVPACVVVILHVHLHTGVINQLHCMLGLAFLNKTGVGHGQYGVSDDSHNGEYGDTVNQSSIIPSSFNQSINQTNTHPINHSATVNQPSINHQPIDQ